MLMFGHLRCSAQRQWYSRCPNRAAAAGEALRPVAARLGRQEPRVYPVEALPGRRPADDRCAAWACVCCQLRHGCLSQRPNHQTPASLDITRSCRLLFALWALPPLPACSHDYCTQVSHAGCRQRLPTEALRRCVRAGLFIVALFVLVKPLFYTQSCLTSIFYIAAVLVVQQVFSEVNQKLSISCFSILCIAKL